MSNFFSLPIRTQLYLMAFIVALPAAGIIVYSGLDQRKNAITEARTESKKLVDNIATEQQATVAAAKQLLSVLAQLPEIKSGNRAKAEPVLADILKINPQFLNIFVTDRGGRMWASAIPAHAAISIADRRHFINARTNNQFSSGEYIVGRLLKRPTLSFGYPYRNRRGEFAGVIVVNIDLEFSEKILQRSKLPSGSSYTLTDCKGIILGRALDAAPYIGKPDSPEMYLRMKRGAESGSYEGPGLDGTFRFISYRRLHLEGEKTPYIFFRACIPMETALVKANRTLLNNLALLTSFMLVAFFLVWLIAKRSIFDRIEILQRASRRLAAGDLQTRVCHLVEGGELGELGRAFDEMAVKLSREISECKQAEAEIRQLHLGLEQRVRERTHMLEAAVKEQESFSYSVSHDLRSPLRHINSYLAILMEEFGRSFPPEARSYMEKACAASVKMGKLIDDLLELSRVGRTDIVKECVDLSSLAVGILAMLQETEPARAVEVVVAKDLSAQGDQNLLRLVLMNLLGNAWKYSSRKETARLEFGATFLAGQYTFFVKDNGAGFDMAYRDKLFGTFQRLHGDEYEGTGIGLATVKRIMERHCGRVWGESELGEGATFYFSIP